MKLIDLLTEELPKNGGWPDGAIFAVQSTIDGEIYFYDRPYDGLGCMPKTKRKFLLTIADDTTIDDDGLYPVISREQYEAALAASQHCSHEWIPSEGHTESGVLCRNCGDDTGDWIAWEGGKCPVEKGTLVDVRYRDGEVLCKVPANQHHPGVRDAHPSFWVNGHLESDIVAYRLHHQGELKTPSIDNKKALLNWNGEGLPPVGAEFEFGDHRSKARCLGVGSEMVFACWGDPEDEEGDYEEFLISITNSQFYPVRTEEELMQEAIETSLRTCLAGTGAGITERAAKGLYQAIANGSIPGVGLIKDK